MLFLKAAFEGSIQEVRHILTTYDDGCPNGHYTEVVNFCPIDRKGHPLVCSNDGGAKINSGY